jgi:hypothetical protein
MSMPHPTEDREMSDAEYFARAGGACIGWAGGVLTGAMAAAAIGLTGGMAIPILGGVAGAVAGAKNPAGAVLRFLGVISK